MEHVVPHRWAGVDVGKGHHSVCLIELADQPAAWRQQITHVTTHVLASYAKAVRAGSLQRLPDELTAHLGIERRSKGGTHGPSAHSPRRTS